MSNERTLPPYISVREVQQRISSIDSVIGSQLGNFGEYNAMGSWSIASNRKVFGDIEQIDQMCLPLHLGQSLLRYKRTHIVEESRRSIECILQSGSVSVRFQHYTSNQLPTSIEIIINSNDIVHPGPACMNRGKELYPVDEQKHDYIANTRLIGFKGINSADGFKFSASTYCPKPYEGMTQEEQTRLQDFCTGELESSWNIQLADLGMKHLDILRYFIQSPPGPDLTAQLLPRQRAQAA